MATLLEKCNNIKSDKDTNLKPENLKAGITCLGVTGTLTELDTSDATAAATDIVQGKTAYVNGEKVEGSVMELRSTIGATYDRLWSYSDGDDDLIGFGDIGIDILMRHGSEVQLNIPVEEIVNTIGLTSDKLIKGNTVLGIEGAVEIGGSGDVKLFTTIEEMQSDSTAKEGDLAVVYGTAVSNIESSSTFQIATFPETVILPEAMTSSVEIMFRSNSGMFDGWGQLDSSMFMMDCYTETGSIRIQYDSSDGITYNRTTFEGEGINGDSIDFGTEIYYAYSEMWDDSLGYFIQISTSTFEGLFEYTANGRTDLLRTVAINNLTFTTSSRALTWNGVYGGPVFDLNKILKLKEQVINAAPNTVSNGKSGKCYFVVHNGEPYICRLCTSSNILDVSNYGVHPCMTSDGVIRGSASGSSNHILWGYKLDLENMTISELETYPRVELATGEYGWEFLVDTSSIALDCDYNSVHYLAFMDRFYIIYAGSASEIQFTGSLHPDGYAMAKTQLTLSSPNQLLPNAVALGKEGIITGDGSYITNISSTDYMTTFLPGVTIDRPFSGSTILNDADEVNGGTLVTYEQISVTDAFNSENYISTDAILAKPAYTGGPSETRTAVAKITGGYSSSSSSKKMYTHIYNGVPYAIWIGCTLTRTDSYPYLTALDAAIVNMTDGTLHKTISFSGSLKLSSYTGYASGECGLTYDFENDYVRGLYCPTTAANPARVSMFNIDNLGVGSIIEYSIDCGVSTSMYSNDNTYWDYKNKCFYVLIGSSLYSKYMVKLSVDGTYTLINTLEIGAYIHPDVFGDTHDNGPIIALYENEGSSYNYALYNCETQAKLRLTNIGIGSYGFVDGDEYFYIVEKTTEGMGKAAKIKKDTMELSYLTSIPDVSCPASNQPGHAIIFTEDKVSFVVDYTMYDLEGNILGYTPSTLRGEGGITQKVTSDDMNTYLNWMNPGSQYGISNSKPTYSYHKVGNITTTPVTKNIGVVMGSSTALTDKTNMIPLTNF